MKRFITLTENISNVGQLIDALSQLPRNVEIYPFGSGTASLVYDPSSGKAYIDEDFDWLKDDMLNFISEQASNYASGKMMRDDSEVEIDEIDGEIWLCDYSESRGSSTPVKMLCDVDEVYIDELISLCDDNGWYCVL